MDGERIEAALRATCTLFEERGIWYSLAFGTLLGAIRERNVIEWDYDFDLFIRPADRDRVLTLGDDAAGRGLRFSLACVSASGLAVNRDGVAWFYPGSLAVHYDGSKAGDIYTPILFSDGVVRLYDLETETLWHPQSSFPHFFAQGLDEAYLGGRPYRILRCADVWLAFTYGDDWREPYRAPRQGGDRRPEHTSHGDRYSPHLAEAIAWCEARGWDRSIYRGQPAWPRDVRGAGPYGISPRAIDSSGGLWWRDLEELARHY